jgi:hypothetical protein
MKWKAMLNMTHKHKTNEISLPEARPTDGNLLTEVRRGHKFTPNQMGTNCLDSLASLNLNLLHSNDTNRCPNRIFPDRWDQTVRCSPRESYSVLAR